MITDIIAQIIGIFGMAANIWSYQQKSKKGVIALQLCGSILFTVNFLLLGAMTGAMLNCVNFALNIVFLNKEKTRADHVAWTVLFCSLYVAAYVMTFTVFKVEPSVPKLVLEFLPLVGAFLTIASYKMSGAAAIRKLSLIRSPLWLVYDSFVPSIGGVICEVISIISIITGIIRFDLKKKNS